MEHSKAEYYHKLVETKLSRNFEKLKGIIDADLLKSIEKKNLDDIKSLHEWSLLDDELLNET